jgi:hypothetical protein
VQTRQPATEVDGGSGIGPRLIQPPQPEEVLAVVDDLDDGDGIGVCQPPQTCGFGCEESLGRGLSLFDEI